MKLTVPSHDALRVRAKTSQPSEMVWIQSPRFAISDPTQKRR